MLTGDDAVLQANPFLPYVQDISNAGGLAPFGKMQLNGVNL